MTQTDPCMRDLLAPSDPNDIKEAVPDPLRGFMRSSLWDNQSVSVIQSRSGRGGGSAAESVSRCMDVCTAHIIISMWPLPPPRACLYTHIVCLPN